MALTGSRLACPVCQAALAAAPSEPIVERQCPRCEAALWAIALPSAPMFFLRRPGQSAEEFLVELAAAALGMSEPDITSLMLNADSLDLLEFLAELDESFGPLGRSPES